MNSTIKINNMCSYSFDELVNCMLYLYPKTNVIYQYNENLNIHPIVKMEDDFDETYYSDIEADIYNSDEEDFDFDLYDVLGDYMNLSNASNDYD